MKALVCFTMDNLSDAADLGRGNIAEPRKPGNRPAFEIGFPAMLALYQKYSIPITHFIEGWNGGVHPEEIQQVLSLGHDIGMHGWQHEKWAELDDDRAYELALMSTKALEKAAGVRPRAFRAPGGPSTEFTRKVLTNLGYTIDASINPNGKDGGAIRKVNNTLTSVPYEWAAVDATHWLWKDRPVEEVEGLWRRMLNSAAAKNESLTFIWHAHVMGIDAERRAVGSRILEYVTNNDKFQIVTLPQLIELSL